MADNRITTEEKIIDDSEKVLDDIEYWIMYLLFFPCILIILKFKPLYF